MKNLHIGEKLTSRSRGSTLLLVLAMLSILLLIGIAFTYSTRLETQASSNYAELAQARMAATSGLPFAAPLIAEAARGLTDPLQDWNRVSIAMQKLSKSDSNKTSAMTPEVLSLRQGGVNVGIGKSGNVSGLPPATVAISDVSGRLNINHISNTSALAKVIQTVLPGSNAQLKAQAIMALKSARKTNQSVHNTRNRNTATYGQTDQAGQTVDEDPRANPGQAGTLDSLQWLKIRMNAKGERLFSEKDLETLSNYVTVYSQAPEVYNAPDGSSIPKIPLNAITATGVYRELKRAFPGKDNRLLLQFAANVADFSDPDDIPTILDSDGTDLTSSSESRAGGGASRNVIIGVEHTAFITEVYPDAVTNVSNSDAGQFVEIYNPWNKPLTMMNWRLDVGGANVMLNKTLPAGGRLVVTDNYDEPADSTKSGEGSLVSIFGSTQDGGGKQVQVDAGLNIPDRNGTVALYDGRGHLIDSFSYGSPGQVDSKMSLQRDDPFVRMARRAQATPFTAGTAEAENTSKFTGMKQLWEENGDTAMTRITDLFNISSGYAESGVSGGISEATGYPWQLPELNANESDETNQSGASSYGNGVSSASTLISNGAAASSSNYRSATRSGTNGRIATNIRSRSGNLSTADSTTSQSDPYPTNMDIRLLDVFTATPYITPQDTEQAGGDTTPAGKSIYSRYRNSLNQANSQGRGIRQGTRRNASASANRASGNSYARNRSGYYAGNSLSNDGREYSDLDENDSASTIPTVYSYGKLNINTCGKSALLGIAWSGSSTNAGTRGMSPVSISSDTIEKFEAYRLQKLNQGEVPFRNLSDFFVEFMPDLSRDNMGQVETLSRLLTVGSSSFEIISRNRLSEQEQEALNDKSGRSGKRPAVATARWIVSTDTAPYSVVQFSIVP